MADAKRTPFTWMGEEISEEEAHMIVAAPHLLEAAPKLLAVAKKMRSAMNDAFAAGREEGEGGSARRQGKLLEKIEQVMAECKAAIAKAERRG